MSTSSSSSSPQRESSSASATEDESPTELSQQSTAVEMGEAQATKPGDHEASELALHDCVSLGEIELGLVGSPDERSTNDKNHRAVEEIHLPILLRLLSVTRPLSSVDIIEASDDQESQTIRSNGEGDTLVNDLVAKLEHVAATHSVAEGIDVVTCHLAPLMSKKLSKLPQLTRNVDGTWETSGLSAVARNPISARSNKRRRLTASRSSSPQTTDHGIEGSTEEEDAYNDDDDDAGTEQSTATSGTKRRLGQAASNRESLSPGDRAAAEDSQEATFTKTLSELVSLVVRSLEPIAKQDSGAQEETQPSDHSRGRGGMLSLTIDDSILAESGADDGVGGAMARSDLGSTVASIMHHAPVLRSRHVANALCRAAIPQAGDLLMKMGANCPSATPCLLRGCIEAYTAAIDARSTSIANCAKEGALALAQLSLKEESRVYSSLQLFTCGGVMLDVQLKLGINSRNVSFVCCLLIRHLSSPHENSVSENDEPSVSPKGQGKEPGTLGQATGEPPASDFRNMRDRERNPFDQGREPTLGYLLTENLALMKQTLDFIKIELSLIHNNDGQFSIGKLCLLLKAAAYLLLIRTKHAMSTRQADHRSIWLLDNFTPELQRLNQCLRERIPDYQTIPEASDMDNVFCLLQCTIILSWSRVLAGRDTDYVALNEKCQSTVRDVESFPSVSRTCDAFVARLKWFMMHGDTIGLHSHILHVLSRNGGWSEFDRQQQRTRMSCPTLGSGLSRFCENMRVRVEGCNIKDESEIDAEESLLVQVSVLLLETKAKRDDPTVADRIHLVLKKILSDETIEAETLICHDNVAKFVVEATGFLARLPRTPQIPAILPVQIEARGAKVGAAQRWEEEAPTRVESQFLLQLLHAFEFMERNPKSPFIFDPRSLPIKHSLLVCRCLMSKGKAPFLTSKLLDQVESFLPDVFVEVELQDTVSNPFPFISLQTMSRQETREHLQAAIRTSIGHSNPDMVASSLEGVFLGAKLRLSGSELCTTVVSALLSTPNKPPPYFTYALLCQDPLVLLKCKMKIWKCRGLRRITLATLCSLLEVNTSLVYECSLSESSADELLAARNALVVRCMLIAMSGADSDVPAFNCSMATSVLRRLFAGQRGLATVLIKQGLPDSALDWLIEYVPETMGDSQDLIHLVSDRGFLTPAERLVAADAVLRIAIAHGHSNETEAERMAYTALTQLINCFFLVIGPVGVPVNALVRDGSLDVTQISRNAAFRILKSLLKVRGRRTRLRNECGMALQKLANLCKGETVFSGVAGAVAGRRKILLKEIFDAVMKAVNSMGSAIGSQSVAA